MELWDVYDSERRPQGRTMVRGSEFKPGDMHLVVEVCAFNSKGEMLIQRRHPSKEGFPNMWEFTASGSVLAGETSAQGAERELLEEVGLHASFEGKAPNFTATMGNNFYDFFIIELEAEISELTLQPEEVSEAKWASREEILSLLDNKEFVPYHKSLIELLFAAHDCNNNLGRV